MTRLDTDDLFLSAYLLAFGATLVEVRHDPDCRLELVFRQARVAQCLPIYQSGHIAVDPVKLWNCLDQVTEQVFGDAECRFLAEQGGEEA